MKNLKNIKDTEKIGLNKKEKQKSFFPYSNLF